MILFFMFISSAYPSERVKWSQGEEVNVELNLGIERKVMFPEAVRLGLKQKYAEMFNYSLIDNSLYITPISNFNEKLTVQGLDSGRFYVLQSAVTENGNRAKDDLVIHVLEEATNQVNQVVDGGSKKIIPRQEISPIDLVQYVSQTLYAPSEKLIEPTPSVKRVAIKKREIPYLYRGGELVSDVIGGWSGGGLYVTAVKMKNTTSNTVTFDACRIRGDFYSVVAQFKKAFPAGNAKDFTVIYLLSEKPFDIAVSSQELLCV